MKVLICVAFDLCACKTEKYYKRVLCTGPLCITLVNLPFEYAKCIKSALKKKKNVKKKTQYAKCTRSKNRLFLFFFFLSMYIKAASLI